MELFDFDARLTYINFNLLIVSAKVSSNHHRKFARGPKLRGISGRFEWGNLAAMGVL